MLTRRFGIVRLLAWGLAVAGLPLGAVSAQSSRIARPDCSRVRDLLESDSSGAKLGSRTQRAVLCGSEGGRALAQYLRTHRQSRSQDSLQVVHLGIWRLRSEDVLSALLDIAGDRGASVEARLLSVASLMAYADSSVFVHHRDLVTPGPQAGCLLGRLDPMGSLIGAKPSDTDDRIESVAREISADATAPAVVRRAGGCLLEILLRSSK